MEVMISIQDGTAGGTDRLSLNLTDDLSVVSVQTMESIDQYTRPYSRSQSLFSIFLFLLLRSFNPSTLIFQLHKYQVQMIYQQ